MFLVLFSKSSFSVVYSPLYFHEDVNFMQPIDAYTSLDYLNSLIGSYAPCTLLTKYGVLNFIQSDLSDLSDSCFWAGWSLENGYHKEFFDSLGFLSHVDTADVPPVCPATTTASIFILTYNFSETYQFSSDCSSDGCIPALSYFFKKFYLCLGLGYPSPSLFSEETAKKRNELLSQSNSNLGSIAGSNSAATELLKKIKDALLSLNSANFGIFGTNADSSEYESTLSDSNINVSSISPFMSEIGSCPKGISISVMNSTHYLSYQPLCDFAQNLRPLVVAAARVAAAWLVIGAL
ncbi:MAG: virulence factor TspB C-terminal domain-related protein [Methylococcales bacterium]|nr:virulence factor TspB C-terminal domain-related protein [Methylococcales bacterium]